MIEHLQSKCSACFSAGNGAVHASEKAEVHKKDAKKHDDNGPFEIKKIVRIHRDKVQAVALSESQFATVSWDCTVKLYNLQAEKVVKSFGKPKCRWTTDHTDHTGHTDPHSTGFHLGLPHISVFGSPPRADPKKEEEEQSLHGLYSVAFCEIPDMRDILACASGSGGEPHGSIHIWNTQSGKRLLHIRGHSGDVNSVEFHPRQHCLASGSDDCTAKIWDVLHMGGTELRTLAGHDKPVYGTSFLGKTMDYFVATCSFDTLCRVFDMRTQDVVQELSFHTEEVIGMALSESGHLLATGGDDGQIALYDIRTWRRTQVIDTNQVHDGSEVKRLAIDRSGTMLAAPCVTGDVLVYDISHPQAKLVATLAGHGDCVFGVAWGVDNESGRRVLVSASHDWTSRVWVEKGKGDHHRQR